MSQGIELFVYPVKDIAQAKSWDLHICKSNKKILSHHWTSLSLMPTMTEFSVMNLKNI